MNAMMADMKQKFSQKRMDEAARVQDELSKLDTGEGSTTSSGDNAASSGAVLFPGKGGIVVEDSAFVAKDLLLDNYLRRPPSFISYVPPANDEDGAAGAAANVQAAMERASGVPTAGPVSVPVTARRDVIGPGGDRPGPRGGTPTSTLSGEREREQERLQRIKARGMAGGSVSNQRPQQQTPRQQQPIVRTSSNARERARLEKMKAMGTGNGKGGVGPEAAKIANSRPSVSGSAAGSGGAMERSTLGRGEAAERTAKTSAQEREQQRLQGIKLMGQPATAATSNPPSTRRFGEPGDVQQPPSQPNAVAGDANRSGSSTDDQSSQIRQLQEAHRAEMIRLRAEMEDAANQTLTQEIVKIAKIHAREITRLKSNFDTLQAERDGPGAWTGTGAEVLELERHQAAQRESLYVEIEQEQVERIDKMQAAHQQEMEQVLQQVAEGERSATNEAAEAERLRAEASVHANDMAAKHSSEMSQFRTDLDSQVAKLAQEHQAEIHKLKQDLKGASVADILESQKMAVHKLSAQHQQELQRLTEKHEREMAGLRKALELLTEAKVAEVTKSIGAQHTKDMEQMAAQHKADMTDYIRSKLASLQEEHAREIEVALSGKRQLAQQAATASKQLKNDQTNPQKIETVLRSFEGVYDPFLIAQLRADLASREEELARRISQSDQEVVTLKSRLATGNVEQEKLAHEIKVLAKHKAETEAELRRLQGGSADQDKRAAALAWTVQTTTDEVSRLKSKLEKIGKEREASQQEIWQLREWKRKAEAEREGLELNLQSKDKAMEKLRYDVRERDEDVNALVPEVHRLKELTATLEQLNEKTWKDYDLLKQDTKRLKSKYENKSQSIAATTKSLHDKLSAEQSKSTWSISKLEEDLKAREADMSKLQSTAAERSRTMADMKKTLEKFRKDSERTLEDDTKKIASVSVEFKRELAQSKAAHKMELTQLEVKLQGDIDFCANTITGLETMLDESNKKLSGEIVGLNTQRHSTEALLKQSSTDLDVTKQEVGRLQKRIQLAQLSSEASTVQIQELQHKLIEKTAALSQLQNGASQFTSQKEQLTRELSTLKEWKESTQNVVNALSNEVALSVLSEDIILNEGSRNIDNVIAKLSSIRDELYQKDAQLVCAKSTTKALLRKGEEKQQEVQKHSGEEERLEDMIGATIGTFSSINNVPSNAHVVDGGFSHRQKNVASVGKINFTSNQGRTAWSSGGGVGAVYKRNSMLPPKTGTIGADAALSGAKNTEKVPRRDVTTTLTTPEKPRTSNTMSAYDAALLAMQKNKGTAAP